MAEQFKTLASTQLDGAINDSVTTITVDSAMGFTGGNFRIHIDDEIMKVTAVSGLDFTVTRAQEGTTAASHSDAATVRHILTAGAIADHDQNDLVIRDTYANRPTAGKSGRVFLPTDGVFIEHDNGSTWDKCGPIWPMTPPQVSDLPTWVNQGTSTAIDNKGAIYLEAERSAGESLRAIVKSYPSTPFTVEMAFIDLHMASSSGSSAFAGLCIRDSATSAMQVYGTSMNMFLESAGKNYTNASTISGGITGWSGSGVGKQFYSMPVWIKYEDDGTNRKISFAVDGYSWAEAVSLTNTDFLTPDQIGIFVNGMGYFSITSVQNGITVVHWKKT